MPTLESDRLVFRFPQIEEKANFFISFQRTLRIPDTETMYPLPPGFGDFPLRHAEDYAGKRSAAAVLRGGVVLPMWQAEAMWLRFLSLGPDWGLDFPVAIKVAAGKINAVTGEAWRAGLHRGPQDYMVAPAQPWLDGFAIEAGVIRQFVAMPLGEGYSVEGQLTGKEEWGGLQIEVTPLKAHVWQNVRREHKRTSRIMTDSKAPAVACSVPEPEMGLAAGGRMKQEIYPDRFALEDWDMEASERVFVSLLNAKDWKSVTGEDAPNQPPTADDYARAGLPWFEHYGVDQLPLPGGVKLTNIKSIEMLYENKIGNIRPKSGDIDVNNVKLT
ncbi:hypothetical protein V5F32_01565 [Xanthobacter oligotrophicus]|uniref:Integral membrane protein n=1 Tax=Xanthobacter oligotrophicus TaxID=2607286 RepID=A0ABW6ZQ50_9HYPH